MALQDLLQQVLSEKAAHDDKLNGLLVDIRNQLQSAKDQITLLEKALDAAMKLPPA